MFHPQNGGRADIFLSIFPLEAFLLRLSKLSKDVSEKEISRKLLPSMAEDGFHDKTGGIHIRGKLRSSSVTA